MTAPAVVVVGAGLAGLACGRRLAACGVPFQILEASDTVGGRTGRVLPLLLPASSEVGRILDLQALRLRPFNPVRVWHGGRFHATGTILQRHRIARFLDDLKSDPADCDERPVLDLLRWRGGFPEGLIDRFWRPFLAVFSLDRTLATSSRFFRLVLKAYAARGLAIPEAGMGAIAGQLAAGLPVRLNETATKVGPGIVRFQSGVILRPRAVVVATGAETAVRLLPEIVRPVTWRAATALHYHRHPVSGLPILTLDGEGTGPVNHVVESQTATGPSLVTATVLGVPDDDDETLDCRVRRQLSGWFGEAASWRLIRIDREPHALPDMAAGTLDPWQRPVRVQPGLAVCGDHRDNGSIDGALTSGYRAAQAVMADLAEERA
jgi:hypothetical protein